MAICKQTNLTLYAPPQKKHLPLAFHLGINLMCYIFSQRNPNIYMHLNTVNTVYNHALRNDVFVNNGPHIQRWSHKSITL